MNDEEAGETANSVGGIWSAFAAVIGWSGIYLVRLLLGGVVWGVLVGLAYTVLSQTHPEATLLKESPIWYLTIIWSLPLIVIASVVFLPLWRGREKAFRRSVTAISVTQKLIIPAIALQVFAGWSCGFAIAFANFLVAGWIVFLVTLSLDEGRARQFVLVVVGGLQVISLWTAFFVMDPLTPDDGIEIKLVFWLGSVPPLILLGWLFARCRQILKKEAGQ